MNSLLTGGTTYQDPTAYLGPGSKVFQGTKDLGFFGIVPLTELIHFSTVREKLKLPPVVVEFPYACSEPNYYYKVYFRNKILYIPDLPMMNSTSAMTLYSLGLMFGTNPDEWDYRLGHPVDQTKSIVKVTEGIRTYSLSVRTPTASKDFFTSRPDMTGEISIFEHLQMEMPSISSMVTRDMNLLTKNGRGPDFITCGCYGGKALSVYSGTFLTHPGPGPDGNGRWPERFLATDTGYPALSWWPVLELLPGIEQKE